MSITCAAAAATVRNVRRAITKVELPVADLPAFLCPGLLHIRPSPRTLNLFATRQSTRRFQGATPPQRRRVTTAASSNVPQPAGALQKLPRQCPGCGAYSQFVDKEEAGFYTLTRKTIKDFLGTGTKRDKSAEDAIVNAALKNAGSTPAGLFFEEPKIVKPVEPPFCDRCHGILNHSNGVSIHHPTAHAIQDTILESPHKYNHIYHIIDAADFPMSLIPQLQKMLHATPQRSHNRRSKTDRFYRGKKIEMSFIITRSDLLAAKKEMVDSMMPYLRDVLRDALGRSAKDVRLGNVRCVSAKRQWWTGTLKEDIFTRGGGGWMVGKVNVGKSQLLHEVFPKGRREVEGKKKVFQDKVIVMTGGKEEESAPNLGQDGSPIPEGNGSETPALPKTSESETPVQSEQAEPGTNDPYHEDFIDSSSLLPPLPEEVDYPIMPIVSSLPGTTASPIRLSFGRGKGELIDLPGLSRGDLELHVKPEHRASLVMRQRVEPKQQSVTPGDSLLLGGFIRITPTSDDVVLLTYNFTPLHSHRTSTVKAIEIQGQFEEARKVENIALPEAAAKTKLAGTFYLKWDVTKERTGPITNPVAVGIKPERLPYRVLSTDILIEGVGWVELVAQVRKRPSILPAKLQSTKPEEVVKAEIKPGKAWFTPMGSSKPVEEIPPPPAEVSVEGKDVEEEVHDPSWPAVEVYTPDGKFVAQRRPMNAWLNVAGKPKKAGARPRKSMKGKKKEEKIRKRGW